MGRSPNTFMTQVGAPSEASILKCEAQTRGTAVSAHHTATLNLIASLGA